MIKKFSLNGKTIWSGYPVIDLGVRYRYKNQHLGLSYKNLIDRKFEFQSAEYELRQNGLIADYQGVYFLSDKISIIPEIYGCFSSSDNYAIIVGKVSLKNFLSAGLLYNSNNSYGFLISGTIIKKFKIGYFYDFETEKVYNNQTVGSHGLNLGLILK